MQRRRRLEPGDELAHAVRATVVYADLFDFPLLREEIHRDLIALPASPAMTAEALDALVRHGDLALDGPYIALPGRTELAAIREDRRARAVRLWPSAQRFGHLLAALPFARMVAVTGSLAADNPNADADLDYLIVTVPGRLWLVRAMAIGIVHLARVLGVCVCPNYFLSTRALALGRDDLFTAHELLQAVPLAGNPTYHRVLTRNTWARRWLPNRFRQAERVEAPSPPMAIRGLGEWLLGGPPGNRLEAWEAGRKRARLCAVNPSARFTAEVCEGHFGNHRDHVLDNFEARCLEHGIRIPAPYEVVPSIGDGDAALSALTRVQPWPELVEGTSAHLPGGVAR